MPDTKPTTIQDADYRLLQVLVPDRTFLCSDASDNVVVLKRLDEDCLHRNQLHPSIRDRLAKIRELPHSRIATLRSVERWNNHPCLVWVYLDGETWEEAAAKPSADLVALSRSLKSAVFALHDLEIVHGNLHGRNIIVRPDGQVWLTDLSPYLYTDPADDIAAMTHLLGPAQRPEKAAENAESHNTTNTYRITSLLAAALCILLAIVFAVTCHSILQKSVSRLPATFPSLRH